MSSGFSDQSPLQVDSDVNKKSEDHPLEKPHERKSKFDRSQSFGGWTNFRKNPLTNSPKTPPGIRLVWRRNSSDELGNLNKVLNIPARAFKRKINPSPKSLTSTTTNHVSSETLSLQQTTSDTKSSSSEPKCETDLTNFVIRKDQSYEKKRQETHFKDIKMPSVKSLKSLFEKIAKSSSNPQKTTGTSKRSLTLAGHEFSHINDLTKLKDQENRKTTEASKENRPKNDKQGVLIEKNIKVPAWKEEKSKQTDTYEIENVNQHPNNIEAEHLKSVQSLKLLFERSQSVPSNLNEVSRKIKNKIPITKAKSIQNDLTSMTISKGQSPVYEISEKAIPESRKDNILTPRESVLSLKRKWESLVQFECRKEKVFPTMHGRDSIMIRKFEFEDNQTFAQENLNRSGGNEIEKMENFVHNDKASLQPVSDSTQVFTNNLSMEKEITTKSNSLESSVEAFAEIHEQSKDVKLRSSSAQSAPVVSPNSKNDPNDKACKESLLSPLITSTKMNCYTSSKSLKEKWGKIAIGSDGLNQLVTKKCENQSNKNASNNPSTGQENVIDPLNHKQRVIENKSRQEPFGRVDKYNHESGATDKNVVGASETRQDEATLIPTNPSPKSPKEKENTNIHQISKPSFLEFEIKPERKVKIIQNEEIYSECLEKKTELERPKSNDLNKSLSPSETVKIKCLVKEFLHSEGLSNCQSQKDRSSKSAKEHENKSQISDELISKNGRETKTDIKTTNQECKNSEYTQINELDGRDQISSSKSQTAEDSSHTTPDLITGVKANIALSSPDMSLHGRPKITISQDFTSSPPNCNFTNPKQTSSKYEISDHDIAISIPTGIRRSGSRELKPDEIKFFQDMSGSNEAKNPSRNDRRQRSRTIDSSPASSILPSNDLVKSKLRSSTRQCRDLHMDELIFFGMATNGADLSGHSKDTVQCPDRKTQERTLRTLAVNEGGGKGE